MLGPALETFRGNKIVMAIVTIIGLGAAALVYAAFATLEEDAPDIIIKTIGTKTKNARVDGASAMPRTPLSYSDS
jgi:RIO-like serine/threonine protein kinase